MSCHHFPKSNIVYEMLKCHRILFLLSFTTFGMGAHESTGEECQSIRQEIMYYYCLKLQNTWYCQINVLIHLKYIDFDHVSFHLLCSTLQPLGGIVVLPLHQGFGCSLNLPEWQMVRSRFDLFSLSLNLFALEVTVTTRVHTCTPCSCRKVNTRQSCDIEIHT